MSRTRVEADEYKCDGDDCTEAHTIHHYGPMMVFGPNPVADWIILENGACYCSVKCFLTNCPEHKENDDES